MRTHLLTAIIAAAIALPAYAATTTQPANNTNNNNRNRNTNNRNNANRNNAANNRNTGAATPPAPTARALGSDPAANQEIAADKTALDQATADCNALIEKLTKEFEATPDMAAALQAMSEASTRLALVKPPVVEKAKASSEYQKITGDQERTTLALGKLRNEAAPDSDIRAAADKLNELDAAHNQVIATACANDPAVAAAQAMFDVAQAKANQLRAAFRKTLDANDEVIKARAAVNTAKANLADAKSRLSITSSP